jgi:hypothetical protein
MSPDALRALLDAVQTNCDIADARHAADLPLCIYLLQMREFYRWQQGLGFGDPLPRAALGDWLSQREAHWDRLADRPLGPVPCPGGPLDPFDEAAIDAALQPLGLGYGAGLLGPDRPVFFVAERHATQSVAVDGEPLQLRRYGRELARGLASPPAALAADQTIVLRDAALSRWLWERFEVHSLRPGESTFGRFAAACGLVDLADFGTRLPQLLHTARPVLLLHELGEMRVGRGLGPGWAALHEALADDRRSSLRLRAVRDQLADLGTTLPALLAADEPAPLHFWFAGYEGHREALFPGLKSAYAAWCAGDGGRALRQALPGAEAHFSQLAQTLLALLDHDGDGGEWRPPALARRLAALLHDPAAICGT